MDQDMDSGADGSGQPRFSEHQPWDYAESAAGASSRGATRAGAPMFDEWQDFSHFLPPMPESLQDPLGEGGEDIAADRRLMSDPGFQSDDRFNGTWTPLTPTPSGVCRVCIDIQNY
jgi:hypothetical protein